LNHGVDFARRGCDSRARVDLQGGGNFVLAVALSFSLLMTSTLGHAETLMAMQCNANITLQAYNADDLQGICEDRCPALDSQGCRSRVASACLQTDPRCENSELNCRAVVGSSCPAPRAAQAAPGAAEPEKKKPSSARPADREPEPQAESAPAVNEVACQIAKSSAQNCCANPQSCGAYSSPAVEHNPKSGESMGAFCQRLQNANLEMGAANNSAALVCTGKINECNLACGQEACEALRSRVQILAGQSRSGYSSGDLARNCQQHSAAYQPQSALTAGGLPGAVRDSLPARDLSQAHETDQVKLGSGGFRVPEEVSLEVDSQVKPPAAAAKLKERQRTAISYKTIANNSAGPIPDSGPGAKLVFSKGRPEKNQTTDVLHGFESAPAVSAAVSGTAKNEDGSLEELSNYLPGAKFDPGMKLGGFRRFSEEIHGPDINVWTRITLRMNEKCKLGELIDCR
jgi:hypothetical protein